MGETQGNLFGPESCDRMHVNDQRRKLQSRLGERDTKLDNDCPLCGQRVKLYKRPYNSSMARALCWLVVHVNDAATWVDVAHIAPPWLLRSREFPKNAYWSLIEARPNAMGDTKDSGIWRVTPTGVQFARGRSQIATHALIFNKKLYGQTATTIGIRAALGKRFNYDELMGRHNDGT